MKLGALRAAIRAEKNVSVSVLGLTVLVQKGGLLDALGEAFPAGKGAETQLKLVGGMLTPAHVEPQQLDIEDAIRAARPLVSPEMESELAADTDPRDRPEDDDLADLL